MNSEEINQLWIEAAHILIKRTRDEALEEAAKECEKLADDAWGLTEEHFAYTDAAEKIRALKEN